jgi:predicted dehydrogenase
MITRIAIVGSGFGMYCLLPAFSGIKGCEVVSICGKNSERMEKFCKRFCITRYDNWKEMLETEKPDAVAISVIPKNQFEIAEYALQNKIAVFAEKPLTTSLDTSIRLNKLAKKNDLPNMIDFIFPEIPEWCEAKKIIEKGTLDKILNINVDWTFLSYDLKNCIRSWKTDIDQGGGALSLFFSHVFYYLEYFLGKIKNLQCDFTLLGENYNSSENIINITMVFENGCVGNVHMDISNAKQQKHVIEFHTKNKIIILQNYSESFVDNFKLIISEENNTEKIMNGNLKNHDYEQLEDSRVKVIKPLATRFIKWCNTGIPSKPDFQDGLRVQKLIEMARNQNSKISE